MQHTYHIRREALRAIEDYLEQERPRDAEAWDSPALFLSAASNAHGNGRLSTRSLNYIWDEVARMVGIEGKRPHAARHAMGKRIIQKTGNVAAVQRQLGHKNATYSLQYARPSFSEMEDGINDEV